MGSLSRIAGQRVYLDANVFIYGLEKLSPWGDVAAEVLCALDTGQVVGVTSELTLAECLVKPMRMDQTDNVRIFEEAIQTTPTLLVVPVGRAILVDAARLRAGTDLKLPDAIHLATAHQCGCTSLLTNDQRMRGAGRLAVSLLSELSTA